VCLFPVASSAFSSRRFYSLPGLRATSSSLASWVVSVGLLRVPNVVEKDKSVFTEESSGGRPYGDPLSREDRDLFPFVFPRLVSVLRSSRSN